MRSVYICDICLLNQLICVFNRCYIYKDSATIELINKNHIKQTYRKLPDEEIVKIARGNAQGLVDEAIPILIDEIKQRELGEDLVQWLMEERRIPTVEEFLSLKQIVKTSFCTDCNLNQNLAGVGYKTLISYIIGSRTYHYKVIVCGECATSRKQSSFFATAMLGWWSLFGIFSTPFTLLSKTFSSFKKDKQSDKIIDDFLKVNMGAITRSNDDEAVVRMLLAKYNEANDPTDDKTLETSVWEHK